MSWQKVALVVEGRHAEALADALAARGALSTDWEDADAGTPAESALYLEPGEAPGDAAPSFRRARITALFPAGEDCLRAVEAALAGLGTGALGPTNLERLEDDDWVAKTQRQYAPIAVGHRLWIVPSWHRAPDPGAINLVLDPGAAFGTGSHPTTRLVLEWLERHVQAGDAVLDYGCGSGILAIAALRLGAARATAVDIDPAALEVARYNAARNEVALRLATPGERLEADHRLTVANILANPLRLLAPLLARYTAPGGRLALSGILEEQAPGLADAYRPWCELAIEGEREGWVLLAGERSVKC